MARPLRIEYQGAWYHVMNRGASKRAVFLDTADRKHFLYLLAELQERFRVEIHAYCLMGNHYHLLVRTIEANLGRAMRHLDGVFTQRFHRKHGGDGALFRGRYRAILVQADRHLIHVSRYIHLNPVEGGLTPKPEQWKFSSYRAYLDPAWALPWISTGTILGWFGSIGARVRYRDFVEQGLDPGTRDFYGKKRIRPVLGDEEFREEIRKLASIENNPNHGEKSDLRLLDHDGAVPLARIRNSVCAVFGVPESALHPRSRGNGRDHGLARGAFVHAARRLGGYRLTEIASWLGYRSYSAVAKAAERYANEALKDDELVRRLEEILAGTVDDQ
jgi:REP element-mobilizing transposase RayT